MRALLHRIPPESRVAAAVLGAALLQVGLLAWLGLRATDQRRAELEGELRERTRQIVQRAVVNAGKSRIAALEQAAQREIERPGRPLSDRVRDALAASALFEGGYVVLEVDDGLRIVDHRRMPLPEAPRSPRDETARAAVARLMHVEASDPEMVVRTCEQLADGTTDLVARALALQSGWRAALRRGQESRALALAERVRDELGAVIDDRGPAGESAPFGVGASALICEVWRRAVDRAGLENADAFVRAVADRRERAQRLRDLMSPSDYAVERSECRKLVEGVRMDVPTDRSRALAAVLDASDALDAALDRVRSVDSAALARVVSAREPARLRVADGVLTVLPVVPTPGAVGDARAVALLAPLTRLEAEALAPLELGIDLPAGVALAVRDALGTPRPGSGAGEPLVGAMGFGSAVPGLTVAAVLADRSVLDRETESERQLWLWILAAAVLAVLAAAALAARGVMREMRLARLKGDFVSNLSHELRTPLTSLRMFVETLQEGRVRDEDERRQCLAFIAQETDRLATLVDRILQFAAFSRGRAPIELRIADVGDLVGRALVIFRSRSEAARARIDTQVAADLPEALLDRAAMIQVLLNLLDNAVKYGRQDGATIRVTARADGPRVRLEVEDDGPGVPERERELVFEEFYRGDESLTSPVQGAGIGLALCRRIVLAHGGRIEVGAGRALGGACFAVTLPEASVARRIAVAAQEGRT